MVMNNSKTLQSYYSQQVLARNILILCRQLRVKYRSLRALKSFEWVAMVMITSKQVVTATTDLAFAFVDTLGYLVHILENTTALDTCFDDAKGTFHQIALQWDSSVISTSARQTIVNDLQRIINAITDPQVIQHAHDMMPDGTVPRECLSARYRHAAMCLFQGIGASPKSVPKKPCEKPCQGLSSPASSEVQQPACREVQQPACKKAQPPVYKGSL